MFAVGFYFAAVSNGAFYGAVAQTGAFEGVVGWTLAVCLFLALATTHVLLMAFVPGRLTAKLVISALLLGAAMASYGASLGQRYLDAASLRRGLAEGLDGDAARHFSDVFVHVLLQAGLPIAAVWWIRLATRPWSVAATARTFLVLAACIVFVLGVTLPGHAVARLRQEHPELARLITPLNLVVALVSSTEAPEDPAHGPMERGPVQPASNEVAPSRPVEAAMHRAGSAGEPFNATDLLAAPQAFCAGTRHVFALKEGLNNSLNPTGARQPRVTGTLC